MAAMAKRSEARGTTAVGSLCTALGQTGPERMAVRNGARGADASYCRFQSGSLNAAPTSCTHRARRLSMRCTEPRAFGLRTPSRSPTPAQASQSSVDLSRVVFPVHNRPICLTHGGQLSGSCACHVGARQVKTLGAAAQPAQFQVSNCHLP